MRKFTALRSSDIYCEQENIFYYRTTDALKCLYKSTNPQSTALIREILKNLAHLDLNTFSATAAGILNRSYIFR